MNVTKGCGRWENGGFALGLLGLLPVWQLTIWTWLSGERLDFKSQIWLIIITIYWGLVWISPQQMVIICVRLCMICILYFLNTDNIESGLVLQNVLDSFLILTLDPFHNTLTTCYAWGRSGHVTRPTWRIQQGAGVWAWADFRVCAPWPLPSSGVFCMEGKISNRQTNLSGTECRVRKGRRLELCANDCGTSSSRGALGT